MIQRIQYNTMDDSGFVLRLEVPDGRDEHSYKLQQIFNLITRNALWVFFLCKPFNLSSASNAYIFYDL